MNNSKVNNISKSRPINEMYKDWFLDYASYVILERAVPNIDDGLKPVQRRILHSMRQMHDGRYHKVANIIGNTMQYHPHGDQAIGDALVALGQKNYLIDMQGNWGDIRTGDKAAASRYIEARLTNFALEVLFNKNITDFQLSYDGRNNEPLSLPVKFPLILVQGAEGIAVGLSTKILPHNFCEIIKSTISILKDKPFKLYPDFLNGGMIDVNNYNKGKKGGRVRVRSNIDIIDKETLRINNLPHGITTTNLIDSIIKANNSGKIKIKNIEDNTADKIEIIIHLIKGVSPNVTIDALYAFTNCEISISPNCCVIVNNKPNFISINELLKMSTENTVLLLKKELLFNLNQLEKKWHICSLERIFIEKKIYQKIEDCTTWEDVIKVIDSQLSKYKSLFKRNISTDDIIHLTEIKIKRISKYDIEKQNKLIEKIEDDIKVLKYNIKEIKSYSIEYFENLLKKYGDRYQRQSKIETFDSISSRRVAVANMKLFINRKEGFIGTGIKKDEFVGKCSSLDNIIVFMSDGKYLVTKIDDKKYVGKDIIYANIWKKNDKHMVYNVLYFDGSKKIVFSKRFSVTSLIKDRVYDLTQGHNNSKILYFTANPNSESENVTVYLHHTAKATKKIFDYDFSKISIKNRTSKGNILTKYKVRKVIHKSYGESTLGGRKIWLDENIGRLNAENNGLYLGSFNLDEKIIVFYKDGNYEMTSFDLSNRYRMSEILLVEKYNADSVYTMLHQVGVSKKYYLKRFKIETTMLDRKYCLIQDSRGSKCILLTSLKNVNLEYNYRLSNGDKKSKLINVNTFIDVKNSKALGNKIDHKKRMSAFTFIESETVNKVVEENNSKENNTDIKIVNNDELTLF